LERITKPGSNAGSESNSNLNSRSNPVCLEVAVTIRNLPGDKAESASGLAKPIREEARTVIVFDNGAVLRLSANIPAGQAVILSNPHGREVVCRVATARNLPTVKGYIEVEFVEPISDFWGIHKSTTQPGAPSAPTPVVTQPQVAASPQTLTRPQVVAKPQTIPSEPLSAPPSPVAAASTVPEKAGSTGNAPSFEDIAGLLRMSPAPVAIGKATESALRLPASKNANGSARESVDAGRPYSSSSTPVPVAELTSLSSAWEGVSAPARQTSTSNDILGKFSASHTTSVPTAREYGGKTPLIIAGAAVFLVGLGTGLFFMHKGSPAAPSAVSLAVSQPSVPSAPAPTSVPAPRVPAPAETAQPAVEQIPPSASPASPLSTVAKEVAKESVSAQAPTGPQIARRLATAVDLKQPDPKQPDHAETKQPDRTPQRPQLAHDLKMSAPTAESRAGRLVDGSVPNIAGVTTTGAVIGTPGGDLIPTVSRPNTPPAPPAVLGGSGMSAGTASEPKLITSTRPVYPPLAKQSNIEGDVLVSADVDATGKVVGAKAVSGPMYLRQAALDAVRNWKYEPAISNGKPTAAQVSIKLQFRLK
jgi:TonB family protein